MKVIFIGKMFKDHYLCTNETSSLEQESARVINPSHISYDEIMIYSHYSNIKFANKFTLKTIPSSRKTATIVLPTQYVSQICWQWYV